MVLASLSSHLLLVTQGDVVASEWMWTFFLGMTSSITPVASFLGGVFRGGQLHHPPVLPEVLTHKSALASRLPMRP